MTAVAVTYPLDLMRARLAVQTSHHEMYDAVFGESQIHSDK